MSEKRIWVVGNREKREIANGVVTKMNVLQNVISKEGLY